MALTLTLKMDEQVQIGKDIKILVVWHTDKKVRISIEAPKELRIERLHEKK
jgi:carbon storage regulator CsrA